MSNYHPTPVSFSIHTVIPDNPQAELRGMKRGHLKLYLTGYWERILYYKKIIKSSTCTCFLAWSLAITLLAAELPKFEV